MRDLDFNGAISVMIYRFLYNFTSYLVLKLKRKIMGRRKVVLNLCTSLDSFIEGKNEEIDWCFTDQDYGMTEFLNSVDTIFFGRKSYEQLIQVMPDAFADKRRVVFSRTLKSEDSSLKIISDNLEEEVKYIVDSEGLNIWLFGGASLITDMLNSDLIDEMIISIHPLILGGGKSLFADIQGRKELTMVDTKTFSTGLVQITYRVN